MRDSLELERAVRGQTAGFLIPNFVLDMPGEGGKRLSRSVESYDRRLGVSKMSAPSLQGQEVEVLYWDPLWSISEDARQEIYEKHAGKGQSYGITFTKDQRVAGSVTA